MAKNFTSAAQAEQFARKIGIVKDIQSVIAGSVIDPGKIQELIPTYFELVRAKNAEAATRSRSTTCSQAALLGWVSRPLRSTRMHLIACQKLWRTPRDIEEGDLNLQDLSAGSVDLATRSTSGCSSTRHPSTSQRSVSHGMRGRCFRLLAECEKANLLRRSLPGWHRTRIESDHGPHGCHTGLPHPAGDPSCATADARHAPRPMEVSKLVVGNWDSPTRTLYLPAKITKNSHARDFVTDEETALVLDEAAGGRASKEPLFRSYKGRPYQSHHLTDLINDLIQRARLPGTAYSCRQYSPGSSSSRGGDLPLVQSITGHRTLSGTAALSACHHGSPQRRCRCLYQQGWIAEPEYPVADREMNAAHWSTKFRWAVVLFLTASVPAMTKEIVCSKSWTCGLGSES